jgi:hypothetical protein
MDADGHSKVSSQAAADSRPAHGVCIDGPDVPVVAFVRVLRAVKARGADEHAVQERGHREVISGSDARRAAVPSTMLARCSLSDKPGMEYASIRRSFYDERRLSFSSPAHEQQFLLPTTPTQSAAPSSRGHRSAGRWLRSLMKSITDKLSVAIAVAMVLLAVPVAGMIEQWTEARGEPCRYDRVMAKGRLNCDQPHAVICDAGYIIYLGK